MRRVAGWMLFAAGVWMLTSQQAGIGWNQLRWMDRYSFSGEVLAAVVVLALAYYLLDFPPPRRML